MNTRGVKALAHREKRPEESIRNAGLLSFNNPQSEVAEHYRSIRNNIRFASGSESIGMLAITSAAEGDGKSTVAVNLAITLALQGERVLIIDANMRNPLIHMILNIKSWPGLSDVLSNHNTLDEVIQNTVIDNLSVLPSGSTVFNTIDKLDSRAMAGLLEHAAGSYDAVLLDCSSVLAADAISLASKADGTLLVVSRKTKQKAVKEAVRRLEFAKVNLLGTVLNRSNR
ncbi:CpsD/CapB family tyrosine-protein kinase [Paenibacillus sp. sgz500958]|uniref:CpsD/CapB family tyrosine-protein kinase n=1 Tax=Paenibacillus sp. sgz500958 TaxID=3242475 RepID=UPI0036D4069C